MGNYFLAPEANADVAGIHSYIEEGSLIEAKHVASSFIRTFDLLADNPRMAPKSLEWIGARKHAGTGKIQSYNIYYWIHAGTIEILRIIHGARDQSQAILEGNA